MKRTAILLLLGLFSYASMYGQDRDFLTADEADQIRLAQEPVERIRIYIRFAKQRIDLIEQALNKEKPGRSSSVHNLLEDYTHIVESIDSVADDALRRKIPIEQGMTLVVAAEQEFTQKLEKIQAATPKDVSRYQFVLQQALDTTTDSLDLSREDSAKRTAEIASTEDKEKRERESMMSTKEVKERKKSARAEDEKKKKIPSLLKPGEKAADQQ